MTATALAGEDMDIEDERIASNTRILVQEKAVSANEHVNDFAGEPGQALPHAPSYSIDSESGTRGHGTYAPSEDEGPPPTRRRAREVVVDRRRRDMSGSEDGYDHRERDAGSSRTGSFESTDSGSDRRTRRRRDVVVGGSPNSPRRYGDRSRDSSRRHDSSGSNGSVSPRWDRGGGGGGRGVETSSRRGGGGDGSPRELEPSKVLHVRNVGYPVVQSDLVSLLSCFGQVEKVRMFSGQALVQLPSMSIAKATMRHFEEDEEARIGNKRVYINYSRSRSIEGRDIEPIVSNSNGGSINASSNGLDMGRALATARAAVGGADGNGQMQDAAGPFAHLIMEDHAKLLGLATSYLQNYGIPGEESAVLNINLREEMAEGQRQAVAAAMVLSGGNGHSPGMPAWNGNPAITAAVASRFATGVASSGSYTGFASRARPGSRVHSGDVSDRPSQRDRGGRGGPSQR